jgi:hypothetical protein
MNMFSFGMVTTGMTCPMRECPKFMIVVSSLCLTDMARAGVHSASVTFSASIPVAPGRAIQP